MSLLSRLLGPRRDESEALRPLWCRVVAIAREEGWYGAGELGGGVADSVAGRFDVLTLVLALVLLRMERAAALIEPSARLTERFVEDIEGQLREQGIGDPALGKRMGALMGTLGGRIGALREALAKRDEAALVAAIERNVTFGAGGDPVRVAGELRVLAGALAALGDARLLAGEIAR